ILETVKQLLEKNGVDFSQETMSHSDQGVHYTSYKFIEIVENAELRRSMSRRGNCWDNAPQESFFGHMKQEIDLSNCRKYSEVKAAIDDWMAYYNQDRYQWNLAKLSPNEYYEYIKTKTYPL
uniref:IS3 family transposase n=1 Tax=Phascolarctobacterium succinatutens TaxID=626940 RepID=UPI0026F01D72